MKALISLSGGMDSATVLGLALSKGIECTGIGFAYGSKHSIYELEMAQRLCSYYLIPFKIINLVQAMRDFKSALLVSGDEIPEGHYEDESMSQTVVPCRNMIFASILAGLAESTGSEEIHLGIHAGDHAIYPDCRPMFLESMDTTIRHATENKVKLVAPFINMDKGGILAAGLSLGVPYLHTRTCYKNQEVACGKCGSCQERLEAFASVNKIDPIEYAKE